jgi:hypothetical protein
MGALQEKNKSDALRSTINLNNGFVFITNAGSSADMA